MFDPAYVAGLSALVMDPTEQSWIEQIAIENGFIDLEADTGLDAGHTTIGLLLTALRPEENKILRAWLARWNDLGPGNVAVKGGTEGKHYEKSWDVKQAEFWILRGVFKTAQPVTDGAGQWLGFS